jgi:hypothetical protein
MHLGVQQGRRHYRMVGRLGQAQAVRLMTAPTEKCRNMARRSRHSWWEWKIGLLTLAAFFFVLAALQVPYRDFGMAFVGAGVGIAAIVVVLVGECVRRKSTQG